MKRRTYWRVSVQPPRTKDGSNWQLRLRPPHGSGLPVKDRSSRTTDHAEAERRVERLQAKLNATLTDLPPDPTFLEMFDRHLAFREASGAAEETLASYRSARKRLESLLGKLWVSDIDRPRLLAVQDALSVELAPLTTNHYLACAARAWKWAFEREHVTQPWPQFPRLPTKPTEKRPYTEEEVFRVLEWFRCDLGGRWYGFFILLADTGCRVSELCDLYGRAVDRAACTVTVTGKGSRTRTVAVPPETMERVPEVAPDERVFKPVRAQYRDRPLRPRVVLQALRRALKALGIEDAARLDVHSLRRRWISASLRENTPMPVSMRQTGHSSSKIHLDY